MAYTINPRLLRMTVAQCEGIINIPSLDFPGNFTPLLCNLPPPLFFDTSNEDIDPTGVTFSNDGLTMFMLGSVTDIIYQYAATKSFDLSSVITPPTETFSVLVDAPLPVSMLFDDTGFNMYVTNIFSPPKIVQYTLTNAFDLSVSPGSPTVYDFTGEVFLLGGFTFNAQTGSLTAGEKLFVINSDTRRVVEYDVPTPYDITSGMTITTQLNLTGFDALLRDVEFSPDGKTMFTVGAENMKIYQFSLSVGFDLTSTVNFIKSLDVSNITQNPNEIHFASDGLSIFLAAVPESAIFQIFLKKPYVLP